MEETLAAAEQIVSDHPGLAAWIDAGDSWEKTAGLTGHDLMVLRLTSGTVPGPKPKLFITCAIHAREYATAELCTRFAEYLVAGHGTDADRTWLLDHHEIHLALQANPDGRKQAETGLLWRKNTNEAYCRQDPGKRGADLNRNFDFQWGCCGGSSTRECDELYRGPWSSSEPETQAVQDYLFAEFPDQREDPLDAPVDDLATGIYLDIHASGDLLLWPWGFAGQAPDHVQLQTLARKMAYFNGYTAKQSVYLYPTDGTTVDFAYGAQGVAAFTFEIGDWFFQDCAAFEEAILPTNLAPLLYAAKAARTPYLTPAGPDAVGARLAPALAGADATVRIGAVIDDTRYNNDGGPEPTQPVAAAECYLDLPPWDRDAPGTAIPLSPEDGSFDDAREEVSALVGTAGLAPGRHTVFVRGRDADGTWGAVSAAFLYVADGTEGRVTGRVTGGTSGLPLDAIVSADALGLAARTDPSSGRYALVLPAGEWSLRAAAPFHLHQTVEAVSVAPAGASVLDFSPSPAPPVLLVDDDDENPDVRGQHTDALDALGVAYAIWDTHNSDHEPGPLDLEPYRRVVWFSGAERGGSAGPAGPGAEALGNWLDGGGCLLLASQEHYGDRGLTPLMESRLGVASVTDDARHTSVTGQGDPFGGLGPYSLDYPYTNRSDGLTPDGTAATAFLGSAGGAATSKDGGHWRTTFWGFGLETLPAAEDRQEVLGAFLDWCAALEAADADGDGVANDDDCAPGDPDVWAAPTAVRDLRVAAGAVDNLTWTSPSGPGAEQLSYDVLRSTEPAGFHTADCIAANLGATVATDASEPPPGVVSCYLVRARNDCGETLGADSSSVPRMGPACF